MGLAAYKEDLDELVASMPPAPSRPVAHPILIGVRNQSKAEKVIVALDAYEKNVLDWRVNGLSILHLLRRTLAEAKANAEAEAIRYAIDDTIPQILDAIARMQGVILERWDKLDELGERRLDPAEKRFIKYLQKRTRDFGRNTAAKLDYLRDAFLAVAWDFDPEASEESYFISKTEDLEDFFAGLPSKE